MIGRRKKGLQASSSKAKKWREEIKSDEDDANDEVQIHFLFQIVESKHQF